MSGPEVIARPVVMDRLKAAVERAPVTLVSAEAGSGKTAAVRAWYAERTAAKAWLTVDAGANTPGTLWQQMLQALPGGRPASRPVAYSKLLTLTAALAEATVVVLDDLHELTDRDVLAELRCLIDRQPPALRLVLVTRSDPPLRLHRWRVAGTLADIRTADLLLGCAAAADFAARQGLRLTPEQLDALLARTRGWAAGLQLATEALRGREPADMDAAIAEFTGQRRDVTEYIVSEVLGSAPAGVPAFLTRTSVVEELTGPFAEALMEDPGAPALLERLAAEHELLVVASADGTYRYHPLLREACYHELTSRRPVLGRIQHGRAASWYADRGRWIEAVHHAMLSHDADRITRVLLTALPRLYSAEADAFVEALRPAGTAAYPVGLAGPLAAAAEHLHQRDLDALRCDLVRCRENPPPADLGDAVAAVLRVLDLEVAAGRPDAAGTITVAEDARRLLDQAGPVIGPVVAAYRAIVECRLGIGLMWMMRPLQAEASLRAALRPALARDLVRVQALGHAHLAWLAAGAGGCRAGERHAEAALRLPGTWAAPARLALAYVHLLRAEYGAAADQLRRWTLQDADPLGDLAGMIMDARLQLALGAHTRVDAILAEAREKVARDHASAPLLHHWLAGVTVDADLARRAYPSIGEIAAGESGAERIRAARAELDQGRVAEAEAVVRAVLAEGPGVLTEVRARVVDAVAQRKARRDSAALAAIDRALAVAEPEGLLLPFAELDQCLDIVRLYRDLGGTYREFADLVMALAGTPPTPAGLAEQLTDREVVVLRHLPTLQANTEIGESMFVTVNTVKAHLKAIYRKLGVTNRRAAVERARELHLL